MGKEKGRDRQEKGRDMDRRRREGEVFVSWSFEDQFLPFSRQILLPFS
jgi:hypothetical protein